MKHNLAAYRYNVFSQNGEDGVVEEICKRLGIKKGWFCEFGAWDGKYGSNTYALLRKDWQGVMIEGNSARFKDLERTARKYQDDLWIQRAYVDHKGGEDSLDNLLQKTPIPSNFEILSIDIDSYDYHVWRSLKMYRPKLVIIEIDSSIQPGEEYIYSGGEKLTSFSAMLNLGINMKYTLVCHTGNLFFIENESLQALNIDPIFISAPETMFIEDWVSPTYLQVLVRKVKYLTWQRIFVKLVTMLRNSG